MSKSQEDFITSEFEYAETRIEVLERMESIVVDKGNLNKEIGKLRDEICLKGNRLVNSAIELTREELLLARKHAIETGKFRYIVENEHYDKSSHYLLEKQLAEYIMEDKLNQEIISEIKTLKSELKSNESQLYFLEMEKGELEYKFKNFRESIQQYNQLKSQVDSVEMKIERNQILLQQLEGEIDLVADDIDRDKDVRESYIRRYEEALRDKRVLAHEIQKITDQIYILKSSNENIDSQNSELEKIISQCNDELNELKMFKADTLDDIRRDGGKSMVEIQVEIETLKLEIEAVREGLLQKRLWGMEVN